MKNVRWTIIWTVLFCLAQGLAWAEQPAEVKKKTVPLDNAGKQIRCQFFQPDFTIGDSNYHSLVAASDGNLYFSIDTHNIDYACRFYSFDPKTED
ncbi:MAG: hypothetical protein KJ052_14410, partial [Candidatus Hydrogenedentes bacterium]|nr:hypothetical protein [Candidatus Hydrogenedentota bacterium]